MHLNRIIFLWIGFILSLTSICAQEEYNAEIQLYTTEQGLPNNHVYQCFQDRRGLLWLLTGAGLCRFDGQEFKLVLDKGFSVDRSKNRILFEEPDGDLWISNHEEMQHVRLRLVNTITGKIITPAQKYSQGLPPNIVNIVYAGSQSFWISTTKGELLKVRPGESSQRIYQTQSGLPPDIYAADTIHQTILIDITQEHTRNQVCCLLNSQGKTLAIHTIPFIQEAVSNPNGGYQFYSMYQVGSINTQGKIKQEPIEHYFPHYQARNVYDNTLPLTYDSRLKQYWIVSHNQFHIFQQGKGLLNISAEKNQLLPKSAFSIFIDRQGIAWICTIEGLFQMKLKPPRFQKLLWQDPLTAENPVAMSCRGIVKDEQSGILYLSSNNCLWGIKSQQVEKIFCREIAIYGLAQGLDNSLWVGSETLYRYFPQQKKVQTLGNIPRDYAIAWSFLPQKEKVWVGLNNGLAYIDPTSNEFHFVAHPPALENGTIHAMHSAGERGLWILSDKGLLLFNPSTQATQHYWISGKGKYKLPAENIRHYYPERDDLWWFATADGLLRWNPQTGENRLFTTADGLSNNNIYAVYPDEYGFLWMSSDQGIMQFQKRTGKVRVFLPQDGITHREFNRISHFQDQDGRIYFGSLNGVTAFHPQDFHRDFDLLSNIPLILTQAHLFSKAKNRLENVELDYHQKGKITFKPNHLYLTLRFALLDYSLPKSSQYEYRIEGLSDHWAACPGGVLQLAGLPYGHYQIRLRAKDENGQYSRQELLLPIQVLRPFYAQFWFLTLLFLGISAAIVAFFRYRNQWLKQQKVALEKEVAVQTEKIRADKTTIEKQATQLIQLDKAKSRFFANVTHELRTPLTLILGPLQTYLEQNKPQQEELGLLQIAKNHTERLQNMVNDLLDLGQLEAGKLAAQADSVLLQQKIRFLLGAYESNAADKGIQLTLDYQASADLIVQLDRRLFKMIFNNLLSNALKFTSAGGEIIVRMQDLGTELQLEVEDNGRGIHPDDLPHVFERYFQTQYQSTAYEGGTGIGLALAWESSKAMGGTLEVSSTWGKGSTFILKFPKREMPAGLDVQNWAGPNGVLPNRPVVLPTELEHSYSPNEAMAEERSHLLLVEDNDDLRQYLTLILSREYRVSAVENGHEAKLYLEKSSPDLIISDIMMPIMDGFQLLEWLKNSPFSAIPVIMLTARADLGDKLRALQIGVDDYLVKPFVEVELLTRIQNLLQRQDLRRSLGERISSDETEAQELEEIPHGSNSGQSEKEKEWLTILEKTVLANLGDANFSVNELAKAVFMSRSLFYSEVGRVLGLTPNEYINEIRLLKAMELFQSQRGEYSVKEMASLMGYRDEKYFSRQFKQRFGVLPSQLR